MRKKNTDASSKNPSDAIFNYILLSFAKNVWVVLLISLFAVQAVWHAQVKSATYDEPAHLSISYLLWKTEYKDYDVSHPPLLRYLFGIPLLFLKTSLPGTLPAPVSPPGAPLADRPGSYLYLYSGYFLYQNSAPADQMLFWTRMVSVFFGCLMAIWVFLWSRDLYGTKGGLLSLILFCFCPNLIAHSSLVTTDLGGVTFAVGFLYSLYLLAKEVRPGKILFSGALLGLALISKYTNVLLVPVFLAAWPFLNRDASRSAAKIIKTQILALAVSWAVLCAGYGFEKVFMEHTLSLADWGALGYGNLSQTLYRFLPLPDSYLQGIVYGAIHNQRGHGGFLLGNYSSLGWWYYFPVAFLLKTPTAALLLCLIAIFSGKINRQEAVLCAAGALYLGSAMGAKLNIGVRHILTYYPLLYVFLGRVADRFETKHPRNKIIFCLFSLLLAGETLSLAPDYLAFFNRLCGGPAKGIEYLSDSNIDWGQDLKSLSSFLKKEGNPELVLSYFGTAVPAYYGITYQGLPTVWPYPKSEHINSVSPGNEYLAVSVTCLQGTYFLKHDLYGWLKNKKPLARLGWSIYVFDITHDLESQKKLLEIYQLTGEKEKVLRQMERIRRMS